jgi:hypothetical protein
MSRIADFGVQQIEAAKSRTLAPKLIPQRAASRSIDIVVLACRLLLPGPLVEIEMFGLLITQA